MTNVVRPKTYYLEPCSLGGDYLVAKSKIDGSYIGLPEYAQKLEALGIAPEKSHPDHRVASIGFCEKEQKWYGWSHRAMFGFGVGSSVVKGDCGYVSVGWDDFIERSIEFWTEEDGSRINVTGERIANPDKHSRDEYPEVARVSWIYLSDAKLIPNLKLHGKKNSVLSYPPKVWGKGEWTASNLEEAKQMAIDFAEGVA